MHACAPLSVANRTRSLNTKISAQIQQFVSANERARALEQANSFLLLLPGGCGTAGIARTMLVASPWIQFAFPIAWIERSNEIKFALNDFDRHIFLYK